MIHGTASGGDGRRSFKVGEPPIGEERKLANLEYLLESKAAGIRPPSRGSIIIVFAVVSIRKIRKKTKDGRKYHRSRAASSACMHGHPSCEHWLTRICAMVRLAVDNQVFRDNGDLRRLEPRGGSVAAMHGCWENETSHRG
jgi:hypothetical protein